MNKHAQALRDIKEVREKIKGLGFLGAAKMLGGYNCDGTLFDYDYGCITGTIINDNGAAAISDGTRYDVYDDDYLNNGVIEHFTEQQLKGLANG